MSARLRRIITVVSIAGVVFGLQQAVAAGPAGAAAVTAAADQAKPTPSTAVIKSGALSATLDTAFPQVTRYSYGTTGILYGHQGATPQVQINGTSHTPTVTARTAGDHVDYTLTFTDIDVTAKVIISVKNSILDWHVTAIKDGAATRVSTFGIAGQDLVSVHGDQTGATVSHATVYGTNYAPGPDLDKFDAVASTPVDATPQVASVALLNTSTVAAAVQSNSVQTYGNLQLQTTTDAATSSKQTAVWSNSWTYRGPDGKVVALPDEKVALTADANRDHTVDWQDGAIAFRSIMVIPTGAAQVKSNVVSQISMNFASQAEHPFIQTLDDIKKTSLLTDGLGQSIELKGYQGQGHDDAHPSYAGDYNLPAGGLADLQTITKQAKKYSTIVGVHINDAAMSPRSAAFRWDNVTGTAPYYVYGDSQYNNNITKDVSGPFQRRIDELTKAVPGLGFIYTDAFFATDWDAYQEAHGITDHGIPVYTEFPTYLFPFVTWYHDSNEYNDVGINSQLLRFAYNSDMDAWIQNSQPMLGGEQNNASFMGWHSAENINSEVAQVFTNNLPTKWLQHFQINKWSTGEIDFTGGVKTVMAGGQPQIWQNGVLLRDGNNIFLPYDPAKQSKIYAWSANDAARSWTVPTSWNHVSKVAVYQLTDTGKKLVTRLPVVNGKITLQISANTPYVLYPLGAKAAAGSNQTATSVHFGKRAIVKDGEFFSHSFRYWTPSSSRSRPSGVSIVTAGGFQNLQIAGPKDGRVIQRLSGLKPGHTYAALAWVSVTGGRTATLQVDPGSGRVVSNSIDATPPVDTDADGRLHAQNFQRIQVLFTAKRSTAQLTLSGAASTDADAKVEFTDVRVAMDDGATNTADGHFFTEDFEHDAQGWGPFIEGAAGGEPSMWLSSLHTGYTRDTISGQHSLNTIDNSAGIQARTWPGTIDFQPSHAYRVRLDYQADAGGPYTFDVRADGQDDPLVSVPLAQTTDRALNSSPPATDPKPAGWTDSLPPQYSAPHASVDTTFVAGSDAAYLALNQLSSGSGSASIDNLVVDDLGPASAADSGKALASMAIIPTQLPGGATNPVTVSYTNTSAEVEASVALTLTSPNGWTITAKTATTANSVPAGATVKASYDVAVPKTAPGGDNVLTVHASYRWYGQKLGVTSSVNELVAFASLAAAFNNVGITDNADTTPGQFDGAGGNSFSAQSLAAAGATRGGTITTDGVTFDWPDVPAGTPDNVTANGQTISLSGTGELAVLGAASALSQTGTVHIGYTDGSSSDGRLGMPNWCCESTTDYGSRVAVDSVGNNGPDGPYHPTTHYEIYYNTVPLDQGKTVASVTLPANPNMHFFAIAIKKLVAAPPTADTEASDLQWTSATNGWGPVERDHSNGEDQAGDGNEITLGGVKYAKGLGTAPIGDGNPGVVTYRLGGHCTSLTTIIGLDGEEPTRGSVGFAVVADGATVFSSGVFTPATAPQHITVPLTGAQQVQLQVNTGGDGPGNDHGDWAAATFHCS